MAKERTSVNYTLIPFADKVNLVPGFYDVHTQEPSGNITSLES